MECPLAESSDTTVCRRHLAAHSISYPAVCPNSHLHKFLPSAINGGQWIHQDHKSRKYMYIGSLCGK